MRNISDKIVEKVKTPFIFNNTFPQILPFCETAWNKTVQPDRPQIVRNTPFACWIQLRLQTRTQNM